MRFRTFWAAVAALLLTGSVLSHSAVAEVPVYGFRIVHAYPHDTGAFTEGLFYQGGELYESTGLEGKSTIRRVELETGRVLQERQIPAQYFGEGIVAWKDRLIELTWQSQIGFVYDLKTFEPRSSFHYPGEGWALTRDDHRLIMSDGTSDIRFLDPDTLAETGRIHVTDEGRPVRNLNELEWVKGEIYANIWQTNRIARIDPQTGVVLGWIDLNGLLKPEDVHGEVDVLNGIAYDAAHDRLLVTGKLWPKLFEIRLVRHRPRE
ncbi:glutaminyl-peptide cyclotransferase [Caulobacter sp. S45]|uniref:glutaminyl-peptide cyclotransferase n=1 Tax=Caulobacter sp. S45 TaxID=1641861 RepID=UPI00131DA9C4|nr:glutaminyl-peptide cyclotransferase [Caulobacter sp. S45]